MSYRNWLAILATVVTCSPAASDECKLPPEQLTISLLDYTECLLPNYGPTATSVGTTIDKKVIDFQFPTPTAVSDAARFYLVFSPIYVHPAIPLCIASRVLAVQNPGTYTYKWCADSTVPPYEVKKNISVNHNGRITQIGSEFYDCGNASDRSRMPISVQIGAC